MTKEDENIIFEGRSKVLTAGSEEGTYIMTFKDTIESSTTGKKGEIKNKGKYNNLISEFIMMHLAEIGIPNHLIRRINETSQLIQKTEIIPIKFIIRNHASGAMVEKLKIPEGTTLPRSVIEYVYKNSDLNFPQVSEEYITAFGWAKPDELDEIFAILLRMNDFLCGLFLGIGVRMIDGAFEFGKLTVDGKTSIVLADEISPDTLRLWDIKTNNHLDKDRFRHNLESPEEGYYEIAKRFGLISKRG